MCTGEQLESAFAASIDELLKIDGVELALLIVDASPPTRRPLRDRLRKIVTLNGLWAVFTRLFPYQRLSCYRPRDMAAVFAGVEKIHCRVTRKGKFSQYFNPEDVERIRRHGVELLRRILFQLLVNVYQITGRYLVEPDFCDYIVGDDPLVQNLIFRVQVNVRRD